MFLILSASTTSSGGLSFALRPRDSGIGISGTPILEPKRRIMVRIMVSGGPKFHFTVPSLVCSPKRVLCMKTRADNDTFIGRRSGGFMGMVGRRSKLVGVGVNSMGTVFSRGTPVCARANGMMTLAFGLTSSFSKSILGISLGLSRIVISSTSKALRGCSRGVRILEPSASRGKGPTINGMMVRKVPASRKSTSRI